MNHDFWATDLPGMSEPQGRSPLLDAKVMMIDDEPLMTALIEAHLEEAGYTDVAVSNDPMEALERVRAERPGVLLLDLMMPLRSGFEVLAAIRQDPSLRFLPVIVLTAATGADARLKALQLGATDFLAKPVDASELVLRVRNTLAFRHYHERLVNYDTVTGLPNHNLMERSITSMLKSRAAADGPDGLVALFSLRMPLMQEVRESVDDAAADALARELGRRLEKVAERAHRRLEGARRRDDSSGWSGERVHLARVSIDQFTLLLDGFADTEDVERTALALSDAVACPVVLHCHEVVAQARIGIAVWPGDGQSAAALRQSAELAATHAAVDAGVPYRFSSTALNERSYARLMFGSQLRGAARRGELRLHYQPKLDVASRRIIGAEALVRWQHPEQGLLPPGAFIGLAEELGIIGEIGDWVMQSACEEAARWPTHGRAALSIAINVAKPQFALGDVASSLQRAVARSGIDPSRVVIELTESMLMEDLQASLETMRCLKALGATLAIDDFGTGYSSLGYLKRFPLDELKIDRSFVMDLPGGRLDAAIVRSVIELGHNLGMQVTAEGVEAPDQLEALRAFGCDNYQGFEFSRPLEPQAFLGLLAESASLESS